MDRPGHPGRGDVFAVHDPDRATTWSVLSNWTDGAWPVARHLAETLT